jgi:hypothetical protein
MGGSKLQCCQFKRAKMKREENETKVNANKTMLCLEKLPVK